MTALVKRIILCVLGLAAALLAWGGLETVLFFGPALGGYFAVALTEGLILGFAFGFIFGSADGILLSDRVRAIRGGLSGAAVGLAAGALVTLLVQGVLTALYNGDFLSRRAGDSPVLFLVKSLGWGILGGAVGSIDGLRTGSGRRAGVGITGGALGGLLGGFVLEVAGNYWNRGFITRGTGILIMGISIGLFNGIFESRRSFGILKVLTGPIRGKEYLLVARKTLLGTGRRSALSLSGYRGIAGEHLVFQAEKTGIAAQALDGPVLLNERPLAKKILRYEDVIEAGSLKLIFLPAR